MRTRGVALFGAFRFDLRTLELHRDGDARPLEPLPARILGRLLERPGELVSRDELRLFGWPRLPSVADDSLNTCIRQIRTALDDDARTPRWIQTLRGRGYRFGGEVTWVEELCSRDRVLHLGDETGVNQRSNPTDAHPRRRPGWRPGGGIVRVAAVGVLVIGTILGVRAWAVSTDRPTGPAAEEAEAIRYRMDRAFDVPGALELADRAVVAWPTDAELAALRAELLLRAGRRNDVRLEVERALALHPDHADALRVRGNLGMLDGRWAAAFRDLSAAVERGGADPANWLSLAFFHTVRGDFESATAGIDRALALDPLAPHVLGDVGLLHLWAGRYAEALASCARAVEVEPRAGWAVECAFDAARLEGDDARALAWGRRWIGADEAVAEGTLGTLLAARIERLERVEGGRADPWTLAVAYAAAGRNDDAVTWLEAAARAPHFGVLGAAVDPRFQALRGEPRFQRTLATLGLAPPRAPETTGAG